MADIRKAFHEQVAEKLIEQLKKGTAPWQKPWEPGEPGSFIPINPTTCKRYRGINAIQLMSQGRTDQRWMTYKQAAAAGAQVRRGETGTPIQYWKFSEEQTRTDESGKPVLDDKGQPVKEEVRLERPRVFFATVFNAEQIDGLPPMQPRKQQEWNAIERAEAMLQASGAVIRHGGQNRAFYRPATDSIHLPDKAQFPCADNYYATALHELGHWTGHASRLDRDLAHPFGSEGYAREELRAEIASMILGDELGIGHDPGQHAAYVGSWIKVLQDDPLEIFRAAAEAEKIHACVLALAQQQVHEQATRQSQDAVEGLVMEKTQTSEREVAVQAATPTINDADAEVAGTRLNLKAGNAFSRKQDARAFDAAAEKHLGFTLPHDWNGRVQVQGNVTEEIDGQQYVTSATSLGVDPEFWGVYAQHADGMQQWLADFPTRQQAEELAERLALIDAYSETNKHERAVKLARMQEERVRRDPDSTDEQISAAKEARKSAEIAATLNGEDLQRRIAEHERGQQARQAERTYIDVPYQQKDEAKVLGARWDRQQQSWYVPAGAALAPFAKWTQGAATAGGRAPTSSQAAENRPGKQISCRAISRTRESEAGRCVVGQGGEILVCRPECRHEPAAKLAA